MKETQVDCEEVGDPFGRSGVQRQHIARYHFVFKITKNLKILEICPVFSNLWESLEEYFMCEYYSNFETHSHIFNLIPTQGLKRRK